MKIFKNNDRIINEGKIVDQLRALSIDMIHEAKSGHPGIALGVAPILYTLFANHLKIIPKNPDYYINQLQTNRKLSQREMGCNSSAGYRNCYNG